MRKLVVIWASVLVVLVAAGPALAHVTVQPTEGVTGSFSRFVVRVPTERDDASTISVEVQFPPLAFVSFQDVPGWERSVEMQTLDEPLEVFGEELTETVGAVTWEGGEIEPNEFQEFGFSARMPDEVTTLEFAAIQTYDSGEVVRWIGPEDSDEPAARVTTVDLGSEEGQGELGILAELNTGGEASEEGASAEGEESTFPLILGWVGVGLGAIALVVALTRRRA
ncbi:MAG: YcnI family protein [Actinomycetota bacterium]